MIYQEVRDLLVTQWTYTGGPNEAKAAEYYHDDAVLEFPQSGERFEGKASFTAWRQQYPARLDFEPRELRGGGDLWVAETGLRYDGDAPVSVVKILQFRGDKIQRETLYFADPFPAPDWRRPFAAEGPSEPRRGGLPAPHRRWAVTPAPTRGGPGCGRRRSGCGPRGGRRRCPRPARRRRPG